MKLDQELVRAIILEIEEHWPPGYSDIFQNGERGVAAEIESRLDCDNEVLIETLELLRQAGYVDGRLLITHGESYSAPSLFFLERLTWDGHEFAANIRDEGIWSRTKTSAAKISSSVSITVLAEIAKRFLTGGN